MAKAILNNADRLSLNKDLKELETIKADIEKAQKAGVKGLDLHAEKCSECIERIEQLKNAYFKDKD